MKKKYRILYKKDGVFSLVDIKKSKKDNNLYKHGYHLVDPSPWPMMTAASTLMVTVGAVLTMHSYVGGDSLLSFGFFMLLFGMFLWWRDVVREATYEGQHTSLVQSGLKIGMLLFILSEVMFFFAFF
jgi:hypothetical protein